MTHSEIFGQLSPRVVAFCFWTRFHPSRLNGGVVFYCYFDDTSFLFKQNKIKHELFLLFLNRFPPQYFGALFGISDFIGGSVSMLQYALNVWHESAGFTMVSLASSYLSHSRPDTTLRGPPRWPCG